MNKIKIGMFAFVSDMDPKDHAAFNWWHSSDHIPENLAVPNVYLGTRYVATPPLLAMRPAGDPAVSSAQYLVSYYMGGPDVDHTIKEFHQTGNRLRATGRNFPQKVHFASPFAFVKGYTASRLPIPPEALPYRPHKGVHVTFLELADPSQADFVQEWYDQVHLPDMLTVKGFAGAWRFVSRGGPPYAGFTNPPGRFIHIYFLDEEPEVALKHFREASPRWVAEGRSLHPQPSIPTKKGKAAFRIVLEGEFKTIIGPRVGV